MDTAIRNNMVKCMIKPYSATSAGMYLPSTLGGMGMRSIEKEVEKQQVRRGVYVWCHPEMEVARGQFRKIQGRKSLRNPLTDAERILEHYGVSQPEVQEARTAEEAMEICRRTSRELAGKQQECWAYERRTKVAYSRSVEKLYSEGCPMDIPALHSIHLEPWMAQKILGAMEEQLYHLGAIPDRRRNCPRGCDAKETSYHVISGCLTAEYIERHNFSVYWLLTTILEATRAPSEVRDQLNFGSATLFATYATEIAGTVEIRAGGQVTSERLLHHNKPDIIITTSSPKMVYVIEVAVSHIQNLRRTERLKRCRYEHNSEVKVTPENMEALPRGANVLDEMRRAHRCDAVLGVLVLGALGEVVRTPELKGMLRIASNLGITERRMEACLKRCSYSIANVTCKLLVRRCHAASGGVKPAGDPRRPWTRRADREPFRAID